MASNWTQQSLSDGRQSEVRSPDGVVGRFHGLGGSNTFVSEGRYVFEDKGISVPRTQEAPVSLADWVIQTIDLVIQGSSSAVRARLVGDPEQPLPGVHAQPWHGRVTGPVQVLTTIAEAWGVSRDELATLLAYTSRTEAEDLVAGRMSLRNPDREDRLRIMFHIYAILSSIFADRETQRRWLRAPNPLLKDKSPLEVMLAERIPGMTKVSNLVDRLVER